ncbi:hypothetical protein PHYBOEH_002145 [Phytophthora boehmeriae]|uniref:Fibronectin type-III domain-containing protein n=1 Tax=Phytophthora boehmeriae TaxID=109152 RepID=A0A8T1WXH3_9STRA|nr:hypothetical protein PHYBOEH_002145 [Phytophthora boehmeriae]
MEFKANTSVVLVKDRLTEITLEYRENAGVASISLLWESFTQPKRVVPSARLFHRSDAISMSPFSVTTRGSKPSRPSNTSLTISSADSLTINFYAPDDDGGAPITNYRVEWWTYGAYGTPETQVVKIALTNTGGTFTLTLDNGPVTGPLAVTALAADVESALEALDGAGDVTVTVTQSSASRDYVITFESRIGAIPSLVVATSDSRVAVVCAGGAVVAPINGIQCLATESTASTVTAQISPDFTTPDTQTYSDPYTYLISSLTQFSSPDATSRPGQVGGSIGPGYSMRVLAKNSAGYGLPSTTVSMKPMAVPAAPQNVELRLVAGTSTSLRVWWDKPTTDNAAVVAYYVIEWRRLQNPLIGSSSDVGNSYSDEPEFFRLAPPASLVTQRFKYTIDNLIPGAAYTVLVRAKNVMGVGPAGQSVPSLEVPRDTNGADVTSYVVDWFQPQNADTSPFEVEIIQIFGQDSNDEVKGTFRIQYSGTFTEPLPADVSEAELENNLEALPVLRNVKVERTKVTNRGGYLWAVTFLSEAPAVLGKMLAIDTTKLQATILSANVGAQLNTAYVGSSLVTATPWFLAMVYL